MASPTHMSRLITRTLASMGRVGSLALPLLEPALFFKDSEHGIQQHLLCSPFKQALAKVGQDGEVKAGISQV